MKYLRHLAVALAVYLALLGAPHPSEAGYLVAGSEDGVLYDIDPVTGLASNPRDTGLDELYGLAYSSDGILYGADYDSLYRIDIASGATELVGSQGPRVIAGNFDVDPVTGLLFTPGYRTEAGTRVGLLYRVDRETATATLIAEHLAGGPLAFDGSGQLFAAGGYGQGLYILDKDTGETLSSIALSESVAPWAITFDETDTLFAVDYNLATPTTLYAIDVSTGLVSTIGGTGLPAWPRGLAYIPEPGTLLLVALGAVACVHRKNSMS
ncbi:MAG: PQQ-like beta-propeller repeat protein [Planctomycetes bacterium]|nr:PQQ-like beta-propeller repeat protein [Planctomycetota bacterium]